MNVIKKWALISSNANRISQYLENYEGKHEEDNTGTT